MNESANTFDGTTAPWPSAVLVETPVVGLATVDKAWVLASQVCGKVV